jgi:tetratricopeptide (TPR) repeat protein
MISPELSLGTTMKVLSDRFALVGRVFILATLLCGFSYATQAAENPAVCAEQTRIGKIDFRDRSTATARWTIEDNKINHLDPANQHMMEGEYSHRVMADINWTLVRFPNHQVALELLIRYALAGGKTYEFSLPECYFQWGKEYAPDDVNVVLAEAFYYWRKKDWARARDAYQAAVTIDPNSATAHNNLGLVYIEMKDYKKAVDQAALAYNLGFPLQGLRKKLQAAGYEVPANVDTAADSSTKQ